MLSPPGDGISLKTTSAAFAKSTLTGRVLRADIRAMIAHCYQANADTISTCTASWSGLNRTLHEGNAPCADNHLNGLSKKMSSPLAQTNDYDDNGRDGLHIGTSGATKLILNLINCR